VGGNVQSANIVHKVQPVYPPEAKENHIQGLVRFTVVIGKDGSVQHVTLVSSPDPLLTKAAQDAVQQWVYRPTLLNGDPVEVLTTVDVLFTLSQ
jgi:protein TonB